MTAPIQTQRQKLQRMQKEALHRHKLAEDNYNRAKDRLQRAAEDVNVLGGLLKGNQA